MDTISRHATTLDNENCGQKDTARCLVIDYDNSALGKIQDNIGPSSAPSGSAAQQLEEQKSDNTFASHELAQRTVSLPPDEGRTLKVLTRPQGTASFIARSVALGMTLTGRDLYSNFVQIPTLIGEAQRKYLKAYGTDTYLRYSDTGGSFHLGFWSCKKPETAKTPIPFTHRPCHDAESIFWTFVSVLIMVRPAGSQVVSEDETSFEDIYTMLALHTIGQGKRDSRERFFSIPAWELNEIFHEDIRDRGLNKLILRLGQQVAPEYALLEPKPPMEHLHEAFRRILLEYLVDMKDDVILDPDQLRVPPEISVEPQLKKGSRKRPSEVPGGRASKRYKAATPPITGPDGGQQIRHISYPRSGTPTTDSSHQSLC